MGLKVPHRWQRPENYVNNLKAMNDGRQIIPPVVGAIAGDRYTPGTIFAAPVEGSLDLKTDRSIYCR